MGVFFVFLKFISSITPYN
ncbi:hypothetical protein FXE51_12325 [Vibrio mimicus]|nr:hypothetical protein FXE63_20005 [Vibrio mimicus]TXZ75087.1 hypothetical protein FXE51_12325 [Vibrio mimicus]